MLLQGFVAPDKLDPKFLDPKHVFKDVDQATPAKTLAMLHPEKAKKMYDIVLIDYGRASVCVQFLKCIYIFL